MKSLKNSTLKALLVLAMVTATACFSLTVNHVKADETLTYPESGVFEMVDGVSLKLNENGGMRFVLKMDETVKNYVDNEAVTLGFVIAPKKLLSGANGDYLNMAQKINIVADKSTVYEVDGSYYVNGCVIKMRAENRALDYAAVAYVKNGDDVNYTAYNDNARNNFYQVANASLLYVGEDYSEKILSLSAYEWLGTDDYPVMVEDLTDYNGLIAKINAGRDLSGRVIEVRGSIDTAAGDKIDEGKELPQTLKTINYVTYYNGEEVLATEKVVKGEAAKGLVAPEKTDEYGHVFDFAGWVSQNGDEANLAAVETDLSVYAKYDDTVKHVYTKIEKDISSHWNVCALCGAKDVSSVVSHSVSAWADIAGGKQGECSCGAIATVKVPSAAISLYTVAALGEHTYDHEVAYVPEVTVDGVVVPVTVTSKDTAVVTYASGKLTAVKAGNAQVEVTYTLFGEEVKQTVEVSVVRPIVTYATPIDYFSAMDGDFAELSLFGEDAVTEATQTYNGTEYALAVENGVITGVHAEAKTPTVCTFTLATETYGYIFNVTAYTKVIEDYTDFEDMRLTVDSVVEGYFIMKNDIDFKYVDLDGDGAVSNVDGSDTFYPYYNNATETYYKVPSEILPAATELNSGKGFTGVFDGNGKKIMNFRVGNSYGFFGAVSGKKGDPAVIKNVAFENALVFWTSWTTGKVLAQYAAYVNVENVYISLQLASAADEACAKNFSVFGCADYPSIVISNTIIEYNKSFTASATNASSGAAMGIFANATYTNYYVDKPTYSGYMAKGSIKGLYLIAPAASNGRIMPLLQHGNYTQQSDGTYVWANSMSVYASNDFNFENVGEKGLISFGTDLNPVAAESGTNYIYHWANAYRYDTFAAMAEAGVSKVGSWDISSGSPVWSK